MHRWLIPLFILTSALPVSAQERTCTREEIIARQSELPALMPLDPAAAEKVIFEVLGCRGLEAPRLTYRSNEPVIASAPTENPIIAFLLSIFDNRTTVTFQSEPDAAEIWFMQQSSGVTAGKYRVPPNDIRRVVLKKQGFEDCSQAQWTEMSTGDRSLTISCQLAPAGSSKRIAFYTGVDLYGSDLAQMHAKGGEQCLEACLATNQCRAITFNTDPQITRGPNCFLKTDGWDTTFYDQAVSAIILTPGSDEALAVDSRTVMPTDVRTQD